MRGATIGAALSALVLSAGVARAGSFELDPIVVAELDLRLHSEAQRNIEGNDGFAVDRLRLGTRLGFTRWFRAVAQVELVGESPRILDARVVAIPSPEWEISFGPGPTPLFSSARDEPLWALPLPELSMVTRAFWPAYDFGLEVHRLPTPRVPIEAWLRWGNGSGSALGNDNSAYALDARLDAAFGRAVTGAPRSLPLGLRLGAGLNAGAPASRLGVSGTTAEGFLFYAPATVNGPRYVFEGHVVAYAGPVKLTVEAALAKENRSENLSGNPDTPSVAQDPVFSKGIFAEVGWMIRGPWRRHGAWPVDSPIGTWDWGALELGARGERLSLETGARDVQPGGATSGSAALRWWTTSFAAASAAVYYTVYDQPPIAEPTQTRSWLGIFRVTVRLPEGTLRLP
jgi:phosphate-selective porin OprO and OprP